VLAYLAPTPGNTVSLKPNGMDFSFTGAGNVNKNSQIFNFLHHWNRKILSSVSESSLFLFGTVQVCAI
jgi:hypothetical protein